MMPKEVNKGRLLTKVCALLGFNNLFFHNPLSKQAHASRSDQLIGKNLKTPPPNIQTAQA